MELNYDKKDIEFRDKVRAYLEASLAPELQDKVLNHKRLSKADYQSWHRTLAKQGWVAPTWPTEYGGTGWTPLQRHIWEEETARVGAPRILNFGINMIAPVLMAFGTEAQKEYYLPRILNGDDWWCQGYSEPGAGSDLASLKTSAKLVSDPEGDYYLVNGQKTWTTLAQHANMMFCLVRTDNSGKKQHGISFLLIEMDSPGVSVRPIITLDEDHEVNEVFFDDVKVPVENLVGEQDKGWTYAKYLLSHERNGVANVGRSKRELEFLKKISAEHFKNGLPLIEDPVFAHKIAELEIELMALETTVLRVISESASNTEPGPKASLLKIVGTEIQQCLTELMVEAVGPFGLPFDPEFLEGDRETSLSGDDNAASLAAYYFNFRKASIYGGSNEIQKNIINQMILGL